MAKPYILGLLSLAIIVLGAFGMMPSLFIAVVLVVLIWYIYNWNNQIDDIEEQLDELSKKLDKILKEEVDEEYIIKGNDEKEKSEDKVE